MLQLSKIIFIFASWCRKMPQHHGERLGFDPLENLENSRTGEKTENWCKPKAE